MDNESTMEVIENLYGFGESTIEKGFEEATKEAISLLGFIGKITTKNRLEDEAREAAVSLESIGKYSAEKKFDDVVYNVAWAIYGIGFETNMATGLLNLVGDVIESLKGVGVAAAEMKLDRATGGVVDRLGWLGKSSGKKIDTFTYVTASYLLTIGEIATKNELETQKAAGYLAEFTVLSEKPTLEAIGVAQLINPTNTFIFVENDRPSRRQISTGCTKVHLNAEELTNVRVYIHLKGYPRATVAHLDIEHPMLNSFSYY